MRDPNLYTAERRPGGSVEIGISRRAHPPQTGDLVELEGETLVYVAGELHRSLAGLADVPLTLEAMAAAQRLGALANARGAARVCAVAVVQR